MKFKIEFECDNAAFEDNGVEYEVARILLDIRGSVLVGRVGGLVYDVNGNRIGTWGLIDDEQERKP